MKGTIKIENGYIEFIEKIYANKNVRGNVHKLFLFIETRDQSIHGIKACICASGILKLITSPVLNRIATRVEGNTFENFGNIQITIIVITTMQ